MIRSHWLTFLCAVIVTASLVVASGCTPKKAPGRILDSPEAAWSVFQQNYCVPADEPGVLVKASLYYTRVKPTKRTNRTLVSMWGNFDGPMRLDISAGIGKLLSHIREDDGGLLVFYPTEKAAYAHVNPVLGATRLGMPFPFSLTELARVAVGDFSGLTPRSFIEATRDGDTYNYTLHGSEVTTITLDNTGRPMVLKGKTTKTQAGARTWQLALDKYEEDVTAPLADRLTLSMDNGEKGVLRIKSRDLKISPWPTSALELALPEGVTSHRLDNGYRAAKKEIPVVYEDAQ
ncbi:MAG: hypothetical protein OCC46_11415 [Pseudodesulfovibrio sp.]